MIWALAINGSVFDDGSREGACHPAAVVISTVIALSGGKNWEQVERAVVAGYDVLVRLARSGNPAFTQRGFHPTSIVAPFSAAATACCLFDYTPRETEQAISLAALGSAGLMASFRSGGTQPLQVAWSVRNGIAAAMLAGSGSVGYGRILEDGFFPAYLGSPPRVSVEHPLEFEYAIQGSYLKPYPGCRHVHPSIDAMAEILKHRAVDPAGVQEIRVKTYKIAVDTEIEPVRTRGDAYFNIPYALAARILLGRNDWDSFDERHFERADMAELRQKIRVTVEPRIERQYPRQRGALVEVLFQDGSRIFSEVDHPLGEPENPIPAPLLAEKFRAAAAPYLPERRLETVARLLEPHPGLLLEDIVRILREDKSAETGAS